MQKRGNAAFSELGSTVLRDVAMQVMAQKVESWGGKARDLESGNTPSISVEWL